MSGVAVAELWWATWTVVFVLVFVALVYCWLFTRRDR